jgi:hypothetical protein
MANNDSEIEKQLSASANELRANSKLKSSEYSGPVLGPPWRIAAVSFVILMLELAFIRLIPSEIKAISYFTNLLLFSSFFGLGLGCILWKFNMPSYVFPLGLVGVFAFVMYARGIEVFDTGGSVHFWLEADALPHKSNLKMPLYIAAAVAFALTSVPFVTLGWKLMREMDGHPRLLAYSYDLLGSLVGTILFAILSFAGMPPWLLITALGVAWGVIFCSKARDRVIHVLAAGCFLLFFGGPFPARWSPYYYVQYQVDQTKDAYNSGQLLTSRITVWVNSGFHQQAINFLYDQPDSADPTKPDLWTMAARQTLNRFALPYGAYAKFHNKQFPKEILILGAGSGNDVNVARIIAAKFKVDVHITAVEIDPVIASLGRDFNPLKPYADPRVTLVIDDGRHFLWNAPDKFYDLVIFGTLDSQTLLSGQANLRLDNYIYTKESFQDVRRILKDDGMLATYYSVFKPWFYARIYNTVSEAFPGNTRIFNYDVAKAIPSSAFNISILRDNFLFNTIVLASKPSLSGFKSDPATDKFFQQVPQETSDDPETSSPRKVISATTDDWPYIYITHPVIGKIYLSVFALIGVMIAAVFYTLRRVEKSSALHLDFFFLGVGFSLMESAAVVRMALAFGTTWVVSAVVFASVLLTVFLANSLMELKVNIRPGLAWACLIIALLVNYLFPMPWLLTLNSPLRMLAALALIGTPVFFAGISFSRLFKQVADVGFAFGINMVGAMMGGALEYLSMLIGMKQIWIILVVVYFAAYYFSRQKGDRLNATNAV